MKKLGKKFRFTNETLRAYCGCACIPCVTKCACDSSTVAYTSLTTTNVSNVTSSISTSAK